MDIKHSSANLTFAEHFINFTNDVKNHRNGDIKSNGSCYINKINDVVSMHLANKMIVRFTPSDGGWHKEFVFYNAVALKRILALFESLGFNPLPIYTPRVGVIYMDKANGESVKLSTRLPYTYEELVALHHSKDDAKPDSKD